MTEQQYQEFVLGPEAITYVREWLQKVGKTLGKALLQGHVLERGCVSTMLPAYVTKERAKAFEAGVHREPPPETHLLVTTANGKRWRQVPKPTAEACLVKIIQEFLNTFEGRLCVFEDYPARPTDPWFQRREFQSKVFVFGEEIYHIVDWRTAEEIRTTINAAEAAWPPLIGALTSVPQDNRLFCELPMTRFGTLHKEDLKIMAQRTEKIIVGAYDGEGYLVWSKP